MLYLNPNKFNSYHLVAASCGTIPLHAGSLREGDTNGGTDRKGGTVAVLPIYNALIENESHSPNPESLNFSSRYEAVERSSAYAKRLAAIVGATRSRVGHCHDPFKGSRGALRARGWGVGDT